MNENELYVVKEFKFDNPLPTDIDSIIVVLKIVITIFFLIMNMNVSMILNLQISLIVNYLI